MEQRSESEFTTDVFRVGFLTSEEKIVDAALLHGYAVVRFDPVTLKSEVIMPEQMLMDGIADELMKACQKFVDTKNEIQERKTKLNEIKDQILAEMKKQDKPTLTVTVGAENYFFEIKHGEDDLRCVKQTKSPASEEQEEL